MEFIDAEEFNKVKNEALIIDVRSETEFRTLQTIDGSINIEINDLLSNFQHYVGDDKQRLIVTVCNAGNRSGQAAAFLKQHDYNAKVLSGGIFGYKRKY